VDMSHKFFAVTPAGVFNCVAKYLCFDEYKRLHTALSLWKSFSEHWRTNLLKYAHFAVTPFKKFTIRRDLRWTLRKGIYACDWELMSADGVSSFVQAIRADDAEIVKAMVERKGVDVHEKLPLRQGHTFPLIVAAEYDSLVVMKYLFSLGVDKDCVDSDNLTPLHWAVWYRRVGTTQYLCKRGADVNVKGCKLDETPMHYVVRGWHPSEFNGGVFFFDLLLKSGADVNAESKTHGTPVQYAVNIMNENYIEYLCERGCSTGANSRGDTLLMTLVSKREPSVKLHIAGLLCDTYHVDANAVNADGVSAIVMARESQQWELVAFLEGLAAHGQGWRPEPPKKKNRIAPTSVRSGSLGDWADEAVS